MPQPSRKQADRIKELQSLLNKANHAYYVLDAPFIEDAVFDYIVESVFISQGDINSDNIVNVQDAILVVNLVLDNEYNYQADLNNDALVNILDVISIINIIIN